MRVKCVNYLYYSQLISEGLRAYVVSIAAQNGAPQIGEPRTVIFFTEEGSQCCVLVFT